MPARAVELHGIRPDALPAQDHLVLRRRLGMLAAALISAVQPRLYRSQASIQIQGINENFLNLRDVFPTAAPSADNAVYVQTQAEMLQQDSLLELVVESSTSRTGPNTSGHRPLGAPAGLTAVASVRTAAEELKRNIQVSASRTSSIIRILAQARDPQLAALLANTLAQTFIEQSIEARQRSAQQTYASLSRDLAEIRKKALKSAGRARRLWPRLRRNPWNGRIPQAPRGFVPVRLDVTLRRSRWQPSILRSHVAARRRSQPRLHRPPVQYPPRRPRPAAIPSFQTESAAQPRHGDLRRPHAGSRICHAPRADQLCAARSRRSGRVPHATRTRRHSQGREVEAATARPSQPAKQQTARRTRLPGAASIRCLGVLPRHPRLHPLRRPSRRTSAGPGDHQFASQRRQDHRRQQPGNRPGRNRQQGPADRWRPPPSAPAPGLRSNQQLGLERRLAREERHRRSSRSKRSSKRPPSPVSA